MEQYSRRFIEELEKHIDPTIIEFFEKKRKVDKRRGEKMEKKKIKEM